MPDLVYDITDLVAKLILFLGMILFGFGYSLFALELFKKSIQHWAVQTAVFLGLAGLVIGLANFTTTSALGGFVVGAGAALLLRLNTGGVKKAADEAGDKA